MTEQELSTLRNMLGERPDTLSTLLPLAGMAWVASTVIILLIVVLANWLVGWLTGVELSPRLVPYIVPLVALASAAYVWHSIHLRARLRKASDFRRRLESDVAQGVVLEEIHHFMDVMRFQEPEHGGLMYFLRTAEDRVFVLFDYESQDLGVEGNDPLASAFRPQNVLRIGRAPASRIPASKVFSGEYLPLDAPREMRASPKVWPDSEEFCDVAWPELEARFGEATQP